MTTHRDARIRRLLACGAIGALPIFPAAAQIDAFWNTAIDGDWTAAGNWSTDPAAPINGSPNPPDRYRAWINAAGSPYTVTIDTGFGLDGLILDSVDATIHHTSSTLDLTGGTLDLRAGRYLLDGGRLRGMTVLGSGGQLVLDPNTGTHVLEDVVLDQIDLTVHGNQSLYVQGNLTAADATIHVGDNLGEADLIISGELGLEGTATVVLDHALLRGDDDRLIISAGSTVRTAAGTSNRIDGVERLLNRGTISADGVGTQLDFEHPYVINANSGRIEAVNGARIDFDRHGVQFRNAGSIVVDAQSMLRLHNLENVGTITAEPGAQLRIGVRSGLLSNLGTLAVQGAVVEFISDLDLAGGTLDLAGADWTFLDTDDGLQISNGTIVSPNGGTVSAHDTDFHNIVLDTDLTITSWYDASALSGIEVNAGHAIILRRTDPPGSGDRATFATAALNGAGELRFEQDGQFGGQDSQLFGVNGQLVIGSDFTIRANTGDGEFTNTHVINHGTIITDNGRQIVNDLGHVTNHGTILAIDEGRLFLTDLHNTGHLATNTFGDIYLDGNWTNTGTMHSESGRIRLAGQFDTAQLAGITANNGQVFLRGEVDATAAPLVLTPDMGTWLLGGSSSAPVGTLTGGVVTVGDATLFVNIDAEFDILTLDGRITLEDTRFVAFRNDTTLTAGSVIEARDRQVGTTTASFYGDLLGDGEVLLNTSGPNSTTRIRFNANGTTVAAGITLQTGNGSGEFTTGWLINHGTIRAQGEGHYLQFRNDLTENAGLIEARDGATIEIDPRDFTNTGTLLIDGGELRLEGEFDVTDLPNYTILNGGRIGVVDRLDLLGQTWTLDATNGGLVIYDHGLVRNGVIDATAGIPLRIGPGQGRLDGQLLGELLVMDGSNTVYTDPASLNGQLLRVRSEGLASELFFAFASALVGDAEIRFEGGGDLGRVLLSEQGATFDLGPDMLVRATGGEAMLGFQESAMLIRGTVRAESAGHAIHLAHAGSGRNEGHIETLSGAAVEFHGDWGNAGTLRLAEADRSSVAHDAFGFLPGGELLVEWHRTDAFAADPVFAAAGDLTLGGALRITTSPDITPQRGDRLNLLTAGQVIGDFDTVTLDGQPLPEGLLYLIDDGSVTLYFPHLGDADLDGFVGAADLDLILAHWGDTVAPGDPAGGDLTGDGLVGQADLQLVLDHWGTGSPAGGVPEPGTLALLLAGLLPLHRRRRPRPER